jgi:sugar/nucleoside kinase (ribokinase family)
VFLGNIDPELQLNVLTQTSPRLSVLDSMNFWISGKRQELARVVEKVDVVLFNEAEVRQYSQTHNLIHAAHCILESGPKAVIIKRGEYGAMMVTREHELFMAPAFPLEGVKDPTGAGDSFAGGFLGFLASTGDFSDHGIRRAMIHGTVIASFTVEDFSVNRLLSVTTEEIGRRYNDLKKLTFFDHQCKHAAGCDRLEFAWN